MDLNQLLIGIKTFFKVNKVAKAKSNKDTKKGEKYADEAQVAQLKQHTDERSTRRARAIFFFIIALIATLLGGLAVPFVSLIIGGFAFGTILETVNVFKLSSKISKIKKILKDAAKEEDKTRAKEIAAKDAEISKQASEIKKQETTIAELLKENKALRLQLGVPITSNPPTVRLRNTPRSAATPAVAAAQSVAAQPAQPVAAQPVVAAPLATPAVVAAQPVVAAPLATPAVVAAQPVVAAPLATPAVVAAQPVVAAPLATPAVVAAQPVVAAPLVTPVQPAVEQQQVTTQTNINPFQPVYPPLPADALQGQQIAPTNVRQGGRVAARMNADGHYDPYAVSQTYSAPQDSNNQTLGGGHHR